MDGLGGWKEMGWEGGRGKYFCGFVFGGGDEVGAVGGHLEVCDLHAVFVGGLVDEEFAGLLCRGLRLEFLAREVFGWYR